MAIRQRMMPSPEQVTGMVMHCEHARFVWNLALEQWGMWTRPKADRGHTPPGSAARMRELTALRKEVDWLRAGSTVVQQAALRDFDKAVAGYFAGHKQRPRWRRRGISEGFAIRDLSVQRINRRWAEVLVPKGGWVRFRLTRPWVQVLAATSARVTLRNGEWHVAFTTPPPEPITNDATRVVGIDRGVTNTLVTSDGDIHHMPGLTDGEQRRFVALQQRLARQQRTTDEHGRKVDSNRRAATKAALGRVRARLDHRRTDWVEQTTTRLASTYQHVVLEDLNTRGMVRRPSPVPDPDRDGQYLPNGATAKAALNRLIHASRWGEFADRLTHKMGVQRVHLVPARHTSTTCHTCGHNSRNNRESQAVFRCTACGLAMHADLNAAININHRWQPTQPADGGGSDTTVVRPQPCQPPHATAA